MFFFSVMFGVLLLLFCVSVCCNLNFMLGLRWNSLFDSFYFTDLYCTCGYLFQYLAFKWAYKHLRIMSTTSTQSRRKYMWTMVLSEGYWKKKHKKARDALKWFSKIGMLGVIIIEVRCALYTHCELQCNNNQIKSNQINGRTSSTILCTCFYTILITADGKCINNHA